MFARLLLLTSPILMSAQICLADAMQIKIDVSAVKSDQGNLVILLYSKEKGFPEKVELADSNTVVPAKAGAQSVKISVPNAGEYAITVFHDENANSKIDTNWIGMPKEGIGVSNNAKGKMGPPKFKDAVTKLDENSVLQISLNYF